MAMPLVITMLAMVITIIMSNSHKSRMKNMKFYEGTLSTLIDYQIQVLQYSFPLKILFIAYA